MILGSHRKSGSFSFSLDNNCGIWLTDGDGYNVNATKEYEELSGLKAAPFIGTFIGDMEKDGIIDRSVTLMVLKQKSPVTITQSILSTKRELIVTGNPIYNEKGEIILVATCVRPLYKGQEHKQINSPVQQLCIPNLGQVVATSKAMREVLYQAMQATGFDSTVLIHGESGVGKEVIARVIHHLSSRRNGQFVSVNVAAIPGELFESEMFGYLSGAFTGASRNGKGGLVKAAEGGTLFLDEISELPYHNQAKLLRLLQEREYLMVGDTVPQKANIRLIAASNQDIHSMVLEGTFRKDLFYRLNVIPIRIPPLRERREDILALVLKFLKDINQRYNLKKHVSSEALSRLMNYEWPSSVRQLQNLIERLIVFSSEEVIGSQQVEYELERELQQKDDFDLNDLFKNSLKCTLKELEKKVIINAIRKSRGNEEAAKMLGIHRTTLARKMKRYDIPERSDAEF